MTIWWPYFRLAAAVLGAAAIIRQLSLSIGNALAAETPWGSHLPTVMTNFFSYFTILSNLIAVVALVAGGVWMLRTRPPFDRLRERPVPNPRGWRPSSPAHRRT